MKQTVATLTILGAGLIAVACSSDDATNGVTADADDKSNVDEEPKALQAQIDELKKLLEDTSNAEVVASLEKQLEALQDELERLSAPACGADRECVGLPGATKALEPVIAAVCKHMEDCCTPSVMKFGLGAGIDDAESCTAVLMARYTADVSLIDHDVYIELPLGFELPYLPAVSASLERGGVELDQETIDTCIDALNELGCKQSDGPSCGQSIAPLCFGDKFFKGTLSEGALCESDGINECEEGFFCSGSSGGSVCQKNGGVGAPCTNGDGCFEGYCDTRTDTCAAYAQEGEDCSYQDEKGIGFPNPLVQRCDNDLQCSLVTGTCISYCGDMLGMHCNEDYDCSDSSYCEKNLGEEPGYAQTSYYSGACLSKVDAGSACTSNNQCESGLCDIEGTDVCLTPVSEDTCSDDSDCETDEFCYGDSGSCEAKRADGNYCYDPDGGEAEDRMCAGGLCTNNSCDSPGATGEFCYYGSSREAMIEASRACPATDYCSYEYGECTTKLALGDDCSDLSIAEADIACGSANYCDVSGQCAPRLANGAACDASDALEAGNSSEQRLYDPCRPGSFCKVTDPRVNDTGKCSPQVDYADFCDAVRVNEFETAAG